MFQKKYLTVGVVLIYVILIALFFELDIQSSDHYDESCYMEKPCVRFCCKDKTLCDQNYIDENFNASLLPDDYGIEWNSTQGIEGYFEKPECSLKLASESWEFYHVKTLICPSWYASLIIFFRTAWFTTKMKCTIKTITVSKRKLTMI